jgi:hypothetical protein
VINITSLTILSASLPRSPMGGAPGRFQETRPECSGDRQVPRDGRQHSVVSAGPWLSTP